MWGMVLITGNSYLLDPMHVPGAPPDSGVQQMGTPPVLRRHSERIRYLNILIVKLNWETHRIRKLESS